MAEKRSDERDLKKRTLRKEICDYIQAEIAHGRFRPGDRIVETQLAKELNVSQAPVREAILMLAAMGLLEERPYAGSIVRQLTAEDVEDIYSVRAFIDEYAARLAARRITTAQLAEMKALLERMNAAKDIHEFVDMDIEFHSMVVQATGSQTMKRMWDSLRLVEWTNLSVAVTQNSLEELAKQHWEIYRLLEKGADHTVGAYMFLHIKNFGDELKRYFNDNHGEIPHLGSAQSEQRPPSPSSLSTNGGNAT